MGVVEKYCLSKVGRECTDLIIVLLDNKEIIRADRVHKAYEAFRKIISEE